MDYAERRRSSPTPDSTTATWTVATACSSSSASTSIRCIRGSWPDCGFATFADNPVASAPVAQAKLRAVVEASEELRQG
jgi:hypothetical protein